MQHFHTHTWLLGEVAHSEMNECMHEWMKCFYSETTDSSLSGVFDLNSAGL